jgi:hypothetical protein
LERHNQLLTRFSPDRVRVNMNFRHSCTQVFRMVRQSMMIARQCRSNVTRKKEQRRNVHTNVRSGHT